MRIRVLVALLIAAAARVQAGDAGLPLPDAPVRLVIPDVASFDAALTGRWRQALTGQADAGDPVVAAWRRTPVGTKLEDQWRRLAGDLPWTWSEIRKLQARSAGLALLSVGHLEAVLVIETPLAVLPVTPPAGEAKTHEGIAYRVVARGSADGAADDRRMGLAWARTGERLFLATSERALLAALDETLAGRGFTPELAGLASVELDLDALRKDRYFEREFLFGDGPEQGRVRAALRLESGRIVEVREGKGAALPPAFAFDAKGAFASAWEPDASSLWRTLRAALLEPLPTLLERPVASLAALPSAARDVSDPYLADLRQPLPNANAPAGEEAELALWRELGRQQPVGGFGYVVGSDGSRRLVFAWPPALDEKLLELSRQTLERRAGRAVVVRMGDALEIQVGPGLPAVAFRRTGRFVWLGPNAAALGDAGEPREAADVVRWGRVDLAAARAQGARWERLEGPASPEQVRPFSDRILGLLGWIPAASAISVERHQHDADWAERVVFEKP